MDRLIAQDADLIDLPTQSDALFNAIKHGDAEHQAWLKQALENHFKGLPMPPVQGGKSSQPTQSNVLREALERIEAATRSEARAGDEGYVSRYGIHGIARAALQEQSK